MIMLYVIDEYVICLLVVTSMILTNVFNEYIIG